MTYTATIIKGVGGLYTAYLDGEINGEKTIKLRARGAFRHEKTVLTVGDRVEIEEVSENEYFCKKILERKNVLIRPPLANLDVLFIVISCKKPDPVFETVDKMIAIAEYNKIEPVIIVSKSDLDEELAKTVEDVYKKSGFKTFLTSSDNKEGLDNVYAYLKDISESENLICAFCGASGAGKSTLMNNLFPKIHLETGELSQKTERGKNTTRHTELFPLCSLIDGGKYGFLADTPGFSLLDFERFDFFNLDDLFYTFREFRESSGKCKYTKCSHTKEEGCDILRRVGQGEIVKSRHESYKDLYEILKKKPSWKK
jgi:ribosome biogenesis GTPase